MHKRCVFDPRRKTLIPYNQYLFIDFPGSNENMSAFLSGIPRSGYPQTGYRGIEELHIPLPYTLGTGEEFPEDTSGNKKPHGVQYLCVKPERAYITLPPAVRPNPTCRTGPETRGVTEPP